MSTDLQPGEILLYCDKKHWFNLVMPVLITFVSFLIMISTIDYGIGFIFVLAFLVSIAYLAYKLYEHNHDILCVTSKRIIRESGVFSSKTETLTLNYVQGALSLKPFIGRIFGYGDIQIDTASSFRNISFPFADNPDKIVNAINGRIYS
jgi:uncharacterized membrane protein YdbT with pleckstrin-like domain